LIDCQKQVKKIIPARARSILSGYMLYKEGDFNLLFNLILEYPPADL